MDRKQTGFTLIEILVVVTIIGVLAGLVVVLIPKAQRETAKTECMNNVKQILGLLEAGSVSSYPPYSGPNMILYLVKNGEIAGKDNLKVLFCPGDTTDTLANAGGEEAYKNLDLDKTGAYDNLTSYACVDQKNRKCAARKGASKSMVLMADDSEDHHDNKGFVVGLTGGKVVWREKVKDWGLDVDTPVEIGEGSQVEDLKCLRAD